MARMYRECESILAQELVLPATNIALVAPIDADQIPAGYLKSIKVSVIPSGDDTGKSFMLVASTSDNPGASDDYITAGATGRAGGTVWLNMKRPVKSSAEEENRPDGVVYIHLLTQGASPVTPVRVNLAVEVWGRFVNLVLQ